MSSVIAVISVSAPPPKSSGKMVRPPSVRGRAITGMAFRWANTPRVCTPLAAQRSRARQSTDRAAAELDTMHEMRLPSASQAATTRSAMRPGSATTTAVLGIAATYPSW